VSKKKEEKWGPHSHCIVCGAAIPEGKRFCSKECEDKYYESERKYKRAQTMMFLTLVGVVGLFMVFYLIAAPPG